MGIGFLVPVILKAFRCLIGLVTESEKLNKRAQHVVLFRLKWVALDRG
jgi:hypothetical protein